MLKLSGRCFLVSCLFLALTFGSQARAAILDVDASGILLGAFNVDVDGTLYDVSFEDGTCITLFEGCDDTSDFTFTAATFITDDALVAMVALRDQVFIDGPEGNFDSEPGLTAGCTLFDWGGGRNPTDPCVVLTPYGFLPDTGGLLVVALDNTFFIDGDGIVASGFVDDDNTEFEAIFTYAVWRPAAVPVPAAVWLFGTALVGVIGFSKRRKAAWR